MADAGEWKEGALCELYLGDKWVDGEVILVFTDAEGTCVRVEYGQRMMDLKPGDPRIRKRGIGQSYIHIDRIKKLLLLHPSIASIVTSALDQPHQQRLVRQHTISKPRTWTNVMQCVVNELFPTMSASISRCVHQKKKKELTFKMDDLGEEAVRDIMKRLQAIRSMNNKEIAYLDALIQRAVDHRVDLPC